MIKDEVNPSRLAVRTETWSLKAAFSGRRPIVKDNVPVRASMLRTKASAVGGMQSERVPAVCPPLESTWVHTPPRLSTEDRTSNVSVAVTETRVGAE